MTFNDSNVNAPLSSDENNSNTSSKRRIYLASLIVLALVIAVTGLLMSNKKQTSPTEGPAPDFTATTYNGQTITLSELRGKVVILNFWASWCGPCRAEAPELQRIHEQYRDQGVVVLGVTYRDHPDDAMTFITQNNLSYLNAPDPDTQIAEGKYGVQVAPESFIIDQEGNVAFSYKGPVTMHLLTSVLDRLLSQEKAA